MSNWINYYERARTSERCDVWKETPGDLPSKHSGSLAALNVNGDTLMCCRQCQSELDELNAFLNRRSTGKHESVMSINTRTDIRVIRIHFPCTIPPLDVSLLDLETQVKFPKAAFEESDIVVLHSGMLQAALEKDGVPLHDVAAIMNIRVSLLRQFIACEFPNARVPHFVDFIRWIVVNGYSFNQLARRKDAAKLLNFTKDPGNG